MLPEGEGGPMPAAAAVASSAASLPPPPSSSEGTTHPLQVRSVLGYLAECWRQSVVNDDYCCDYCCVH